ncbi:uncharacterized protein DDB_G0288805-like [Diorhabda sublineata]|uniref:uncharacterized protein DDB_G0288805-like n=1 Tax=Diorhabda sublineata TaxID=1163346 RepID=UPI0024E13F71|nr:uncharacterized protein DDB_G0288805-like [Diorhabda sublineata]
MENSSPVKSTMPCNLNPQCLVTSPAFTDMSPNLILPSNNSPLQDGRESLGILHPEFEKESNFFNISDKEQLSLSKNILYLEDSDIGRESLGILQINNLNINFGDEDEKVPDIMLSFVESVNNSTKVLDTGFLISSPSRQLVSATSQNSGLSFNSTSLEYPSKIFTLTKSDQTNSVFSHSHSIFNNANFMTTKDLDVRSRAYSQPQQVSNNLMEAGEFFWSTGKPTKINKICQDIHHEKLEFDDNKDDMFLDSVFIEGNYIAQKIADGSFLNDCFENGPLDSTPQPEWPNDLDESIKSKESVNTTESVFKTVDKLLPNNVPVYGEFNRKSSSSKSSSASSKSREAKDILQNLSDIFNTTHKSEKQKSEGLLLLNNLAEMLNNTPTSKYDALEDSGHSSILHNESDKPDSNVETNYKKNSDFLHKLKSSNNSEENRKKNSGKLEKRNVSIDINSSKNRNNSNSSVKSNDSNGSSSIGVKIKSKFGTAGVKKGPLRAVIPIKEMKKGSCTPERNEQKTLQLQSKKTSTPINEPKLKPVAASTPTMDNQSAISNNSSPKYNSRKSFLNRSNSLTERSNREKISRDSNGTPTTSKLRRPSFSTSSSCKEKIGISPTPIRVQEQRKIMRRNSITEGITNMQIRSNCSNSAGKESRLMSSLRNVRENLLKSPYYNSKTGILVDNNTKIESKVEKIATIRKSLNSSGKPKKSEKENIG